MGVGKGSLFNFMYIHFRVITGEKSWATSQIFLKAESGSVWRNILENHMSENSFKKNIDQIVKNMKETDKLLTVYWSIGSMRYKFNPWDLKILWEYLEKSQQYYFSVT